MALSAAYDRAFRRAGEAADAFVKPLSGLQGSGCGVNRVPNSTRSPPRKLHQAESVHRELRQSAPVRNFDPAIWLIFRSLKDESDARRAGDQHAQLVDEKEDVAAEEQIEDMPHQYQTA